MRHVYIVMGRCGDNLAKWMVGAFLDVNQAEEFRSHLLFTMNQAREEVFKEHPQLSTWKLQKLLGGKMKHVDPEFNTDYTGTEYVITKCELKGS